MTARKDEQLSRVTKDGVGFLAYRLIKSSTHFIFKMIQIEEEMELLIFGKKIKILELCKNLDKYIKDEINNII